LPRDIHDIKFTDNLSLFGVGIIFVQNFKREKIGFSKNIFYKQL